MNQMNIQRMTFVLLALTLAGVIVSGCKEGSAEAPKKVSTPPVAVHVVQPRRGSISRSVTLPGELKAFQQATLYAKTAGYLKTIHVDKGDSVKQGDVLAEIEAPELIADAAKFKADWDLAELELKRTSDAVQKAPDLITAQSVDAAKAKSLAAKANLDRASTFLGFTKIFAPFSGTVTRRYVDAGAFIPAATSGSSPQTSALLTLADLNKVRLQVAVPETEVKFVNKDTRIEFAVDALPGRNLETKVSRISYAVDEMTKTMLAEADVENPGGDLRPGMYASIKLFVETKPEAVLLPSEAVLVEKAKTSVFVVEAGQAKKLPVKVGFFNGVSYEILEGIPPNADVILIGKQALMDGQSVQVTGTK
jgi:membrane fusion protein, multidrug efflux system